MEKNKEVIEQLADFGLVDRKLYLIDRAGVAAVTGGTFTGECFVGTADAEKAVGGGFDP